MMNYIYTYLEIMKRELETPYVETVEIKASFWSLYKWNLGWRAEIVGAGRSTRLLRWIFCEQKQMQINVISYNHSRQKYGRS